MECAVRPAVLGDCLAITRLNREELGYDYPQEKTFAKLQACLANPAHAVFVAERGGEVVGYLHLEEYDVLYAGHMVNVLGIAVSSACRRQGVGRALLAAGEAWARSQGAEAMRLVSGESRKGAHVFYASLGYTGNKLQRNFKKDLTQEGP